MGLLAPKLVVSLRTMPRISAQREWLEQLPEGTCFRAADVPGASRGAVYAFLSREAARPRSAAACWRVAPNLYWRPARRGRNAAREPGHLEIARAIAGEGCGVAGHHAGRVTGWLTHTVSDVAEVAVVGAPSVRRPRPNLVLRPRSNTARRALRPIEVTYLEAVIGFAVCAEMDWHAALRTTARRSDHRQRLRSDLLTSVAAAERGPGAILLRSRMRELCAVVDGSPPPPPVGNVDVPERQRGEALTAAHLPAWMALSRSARIGALSTFINHWAVRPDRRLAMCVPPPDGENRLDLVRIAATVHALCVRDAVEVPDWVWAQTWHEDVTIYDVGEVTPECRASAMPSCAHHGVWFSEDHIMCLRVHGPWRRDGAG